MRFEQRTTRHFERAEKAVYHSVLAELQFGMRKSASQTISGVQDSQTKKKSIKFIEIRIKLK
jgi:hypothetical protein